MSFGKTVRYSIVIALVVIGSAFAFEIPNRPDGYVTDQAELLSHTTQTKIERFLSAFERQTTNQVVVATFPSLEGESLEATAIRIAERWQIGQKGRDNGVILLVFKAERQLRIEVGYGLEGVLPDALAGQIIQTIIVPYFQKDAFEEGIMAGIQAITQSIQGEFSSPSPRHTRRQMTPAEIATMKARTRAFFWGLFAIVFGLFIADFIRYRRYAQSHHQYRGRYTFAEWWFRFAILFFILNILFRVIFYAMLVSRGGYYGGRSGFGGFSGGGGGGFGGGGASGRW